MFFGQREILAIVVERAQVNVRGGVAGIEFKNFLVGGQRFGLGCGIFFQRDAAGKPYGSLVLLRTGIGQWNRRAGDNFFARGKIHDKLAGDRLEQSAFMAESDAMLVGGGGSGVDQGIAHARCLLLHGLERFADHGRAHLMAQRSRTFLIFSRSEKE